MPRPSFNPRPYIASPMTALALLSLGVAVVACGESDDDDSNAQGASQTSADGGSKPAVSDAGRDPDEAACMLPAAPDPNPGACRLSLHLLQCKTAGGTTCVSIETCPEEDGFSPERCEDQCQPDEYAAACGGVGPTAPPITPPSSDCRNLGINPGGSAFYCCPC